MKTHRAVLPMALAAAGLARAQPTVKPDGQCHATANFASTDGKTTAEQFRLGGRQDHDPVAACFAFGGLNPEQNGSGARGVSASSSASRRS